MATTGCDAALIETIETAQAAIDEAALIRSLQHIVRIRSVHDPDRPDGNETVATEYICTLLDKWGMKYTRWDVTPGRPNVVVDLQGVTPGPTLIFEGHTDVVTEGDAESWSSDPFSGEIRDGLLIGRGAADMKSGLMAMIYAARALQQTDAPFSGRVRLAILADEEGLMLGAKDFARQGYLRDATAAVICEPEGRRVCLAQKGAIRLRIDLTGKMAHGCMPEEGANPIVAVGEIIARCRSLEKEVQDRHTPHPLLGKFHLTPTVTRAGSIEQANVIPSQATLMLDVRTTPQHDHAEIIRELEALVREGVESVEGVSYALTVVDDRLATETDQDDPIVAATVAAHEREFGSTPEIGGVPGSTDGTIFWAATRLPLVTCGPGDTTIPHQVDEFVRVDEVTSYARIYVDLALRYLRTKERG